MPVRRLPGVGPSTETRLRRVGIHQLGDILFHLPTRYVDRTRLVPMGALLPGQEVLVQGTVELTQIRFGARRSLLCRISDGTGALLIRFFHFSKAQQKNLEPGTRIRCWGQVRRSRDVLEMIHPEYQRLAEDQEDDVEQTLTPIYPATERLPQNILRNLARLALDALDAEPHCIEDILPGEMRSNLDMPDLHESLRYVHRPPPDADTAALMATRHPVQRRLVFDELLAHQVSLRLLRTELRRLSAPSLAGGAALHLSSLESAFGFRLTAAQRRVLEEIRADMARTVPMLRLLQGDVGSGKTAVAAAASLQAIRAGYQVAIMAPTELLAEQHYGTLQRWMSGLDVQVIPLSGRLNRAERDRRRSGLAEDRPLIAVGTHALVQEDVRFARLGLVVIDEQHRFGVHQRLALLEKGRSIDAFPHQLIMTATPIPRTLAMTMFADLDVSVIDELPPGRMPVRTAVLSADRRGEVISRIRTACAQGRQVYWVCPLIEESDLLQCQAAVDTADYLGEQLPGLRIGLVHGRLKAAAKDAAMKAFKDGRCDVLVATTVIEVGVDVPNASLMVIENAERLGLSQLHQLRGRIGRGTARGDCLLLYQAPLGVTARERLEAMRTMENGFAIAEKDLQLRGAGELLGVRQAGLQTMRIADLARDASLIPRVQQAADLLIRDDRDRLQPLLDRWIRAEPDVGSV